MKKDQGSSILEVLIAIMILAFAGTILVGGLFMSRTVSDKSAVKREALAQLAEIAQQVNIMPFMPCSTASNDVYPTPAPTSFPNLKNVTLKVEILDSATNTWATCTSSASSAEHGIQKITILTVANGQTFKQVLVKTRG